MAYRSSTRDPWGELAALRRSGNRPELVVITDSARQAENMREIGWLTLPPTQDASLQWLAGCDVLMHVAVTSSREFAQRIAGAGVRSFAVKFGDEPIQWVVA